jgi:DNA-3-methyladenine glycosylase
VAKALLGCVLVHDVDGLRLRARIVETEAYVGAHDLACHASRGRTRRTEVMFGPPGHAYVYFVYGMHTMLNVVTGSQGEPQAVLIRAGEALEPQPPGSAARLSGPALLARGMRVHLAQTGADLCRGPLRFEAGEPVPKIAVTPRIGIGYSGEWALAPLRFYDPESPAVSKPPRRFPETATGLISAG